MTMTMTRSQSLYFVAFLVVFATTAPPRPCARCAGIPEVSRRLASELFGQLKSAGDDFAMRKEVVGKMIDLGRSVTEVLCAALVKEWKVADEGYRRAFALEAEKLAKVKQTPETRREAEKLAAAVRALGGVAGLTKELIESTATPAMARLRVLSRVEPREVLEASEEVRKLRERALGFGREVAACEEALLVLDYEGSGFSEKALEEFEVAVAGNALPIDRKRRSVIEANEKLARSEDVPAAEAEGIRDLNAMRVLIGLEPVVLDPLLCLAARHHSEDMVKLGFFAHESPVKGRETPGKRAQEVGTSASAENIYHGDVDPTKANHGWFYSPGHHKNMFGNHRRCGMGLAGSHWTQLFGG